MATTSAAYNQIIILQSLKIGHTGSRLFEDLNQIVRYAEGQVSPKLVDVDSETDLLKELDRIHASVITDGIVPLLHFETHGTDDKTGLVLASDEFVPWATIKEPLTAINAAMRMNLFVCLSACNGAGMTQIIQPTDRAPCWGMVGPISTMRAEELLRDYTAFYEELFKTKDGWAAIAKLNRGNIENGPYLFTTAEWFFRQVWRGYIHNYCSRPIYIDRANRMIRRLKMFGKPTRLSRNEMIEAMREHEKRFFDRAVTQYFMIDKYPEIASRVKIDYQDFLVEGSSQ